MTLQEIKQKLNEKFNNKFNSLPLRYILDIDPETSKPLKDENGKEIIKNGRYGAQNLPEF